MPRLQLEKIRQNLASKPAEQRENGRTLAAVAMLLYGAPPDEIFFIVRAQHQDDPWSGDIGFPGGKIECGESIKETAERETLEEVAIDLAGADLLGYLAPISGAHLPVEISCAVYHLPRKPRTVKNHEISNCFWFAIGDLLDPERSDHFPVRFGHEQLLRPGVRILPDGNPVLWGITYRLLEQFFDCMGISFPKGGT